MLSYVLGVEHLTESHTADYLERKILDVLNLWNKDRKRVRLIVTDNASNITKACVQAFSKSRHVPCFAHTINLIPANALGYKQVDNQSMPHMPGIPEIMRKLKNIVTMSHKKQNFSDEMKNQHKANGVSEGQLRRLQQDVPTRWSSTYAMIKSYLELLPSVTLAALKFPDIELLTSSEVATVTAIKNVHSTASKVIPMIKMNNTKLEAVEVAANDELALKFKKFAIRELKLRCDEIENNMPLALATLLDPRYMAFHFQRALAVANAKSLLQKEIIKMLHDDVETAVSACDVQTLPTTDVEQEKDELWSVHDEYVSSAHVRDASDDLGSVALTEIKAFFSRAPYPRHSNPLEIW
ncbi:zinc finger BED domain-containing protein 4-like [Wyeomyia smithii]|uniref:zinc finger BED domain-containing protein 4-like n=1 Tax=Wyeomyia smithii TaxID=174621 RepID=UPI002467B66F|nr:zinc finger BED domain-containing protein 4-like [Wyeomyia smithii]